MVFCMRRLFHYGAEEKMHWALPQVIFVNKYGSLLKLKLLHSESGAGTQLVKF